MNYNEIMYLPFLIDAIKEWLGQTGGGIYVNFFSSK